MVGTGSALGLWLLYDRLIYEMKIALFHNANWIECYASYEDVRGNEGKLYVV